ncbi:MAG: type II secretion system F family protein, partial [Actinomycetota bacterium]|nr:type II secretion system F family protein [Actinomycetota bacterium]
SGTGRSLSLTATQGAQFPARSFLLTLPVRRVLTPADLTVSENGTTVTGAAVVAGAGGGGRHIGTVLAIDSSQSMQGRPILAAMAAARAFAARRPAAQPLGVVFFNRGARVALAATTDRRRIDAVLARPPALSRGTRLFDGATVALGVLQRAHVQAGSVVLLSDGADVGSRASAASVARLARARRARIFTVGLQSPSFDAVPLRSLAERASGSFAVAATANAITPIFAALGDRLGREYLVSYRSQAALGSDVTVRIALRDGSGTAVAHYAAPAFTVPAASRRPGRSFWDSALNTQLLVAAMALLLGLAAYRLVRRERPGLQTRIAGFVASMVAPRESLAELTPVSAPALPASKRWTAFAEDVELSGLGIEAQRLAAITLAATVVIAVGAILLGNAVLAVLALGIPIGVAYLVRARTQANRRAFADQLADNLQVVASALRAGHSFVGALAVCAEDAAEPSRNELKRAVADEQIGVPLDAAIERVARRMRNEELEYVGMVAAIQRETGGNTAEIVDRVTETIRERAELRRMVRTLTAQGRMGGGIVSLLPIVLIAAISVINPSYLAPMFGTGAGKLALMLGGVLITAGWFTIRRLVDIKV